jgi:hypothetical protein
VFPLLLKALQIPGSSVALQRALKASLLTLKEQERFQPQQDIQFRASQD